MEICYIKQVVLKGKEYDSREMSFGLRLSKFKCLLHSGLMSFSYFWHLVVVEINPSILDFNVSDVIL